MTKQKLRLFGDVMGLSPLKQRMKEAKIALFGEEDVPASSFGLSSLKQLHPKISPWLWMGKYYKDKTVIISNLFNHTPTPIEEGWSVKKTQIKDYRGKKLTYNSHNAIDFSIPVGTKVCTAAPGKVLKVHSEFNRGGLKIHIDHGEGLMTSYVHLAKAFVKAGDLVKRGDVIALSGYSGLDGAATFPWGIPHVHFNTWLNGEPVEAFAFENQKSLWKNIVLPTAHNENDSETDHQFTPSEFDENKVNEAIATCVTQKSRDRINAIDDLYFKAAELIIEMNYYPTRFPKRINVYKTKN